MNRLLTRPSPEARPGAPSSPGSILRTPGAHVGFLLITLLSVLVSGCRTSSPGAAPALPHPRAVALADGTLNATRPRDPTRIRFAFRVRESDLRFNGQGLARVEPPYRVRLDLFSNGGETIFQAALVEGTLRIPVWAPRELAPPPALLWAALGVFRPDPGLELLDGRQEDGGVLTLRYGGPEDLGLRFSLREGHLIRAELHREGHLVEEVDLALDESTGTVRETVYRNRALFLELTFSLESTENVEPFPVEIWYPGR